MRQFSEMAYKEPPRIAKIKDTIVSFGYGKVEARRIAYEITRNLDNYLAIMERGIRLNGQQRSAPTQTPYWQARNG